MGAFFRLLAAGPLFFVSAWILMIFAGIVDTDVGIQPFGYVTSMVVTIGLWLTLAPPSARSRGHPESPGHRRVNSPKVTDGTPDDRRRHDDHPRGGGPSSHYPGRSRPTWTMRPGSWSRPPPTGPR